MENGDFESALNRAAASLGIVTQRTQRTQQRVQDSGEIIERLLARIRESERRLNQSDQRLSGRS